MRPAAGKFSGVEDLDREIVRLLAADGRMSYTDLGRATGLSTSAVHQRVRRLEERGVIRGYAAVVLSLIHI
jgi:Lrp/AsnC family leucine-responsive transcriptional regulator